MTPHLDDRLARIAPTSPPDPAAHDAARAALAAAVADDRAAVERTAGDRAGDGLVTDALVGGITVDVVTPVPARRHTRAMFAVAASVVLVVGVTTALLLTPSVGSRLSPAAREAAVDTAARHCQEADPDPENPAALSSVVAQVRGDTVLTFLADGGPPGRAVFCDEAVGTEQGTGGVGWQDPHRDTPAVDEVTLVGTGGGGTGDWYVTWGYAGRDVTAASITTDAGDDVRAVVADGYWVAWWVRGSDAQEARSVTWRTRDSGPSTATVDELSTRNAARAHDDEARVGSHRAR